MSKDSISISYSEDARDGYLGYSVANISWTKPQGMYWSTHSLVTVYLYGIIYFSYRLYIPDIIHNPHIDDNRAVWRTEYHTYLYQYKKSEQLIVFTVTE